MAALLGDGYARVVIDYVTDPRTGLPSTQKFLPNIAEIREALEARTAQLDRLNNYDARVAEQLRLREEWLNPPAKSERLKAAGQAWLDRSDPAAQQLSGQKPKQMTPAEKDALLESAKAAGQEIGGMHLSEEAIRILAEQDVQRERQAGE